MCGCFIALLCYVLYMLVTVSNQLFPEVHTYMIANSCEDLRLTHANTGHHLSDETLSVAQGLLGLARKVLPTRPAGRDTAALGNFVVLVGTHHKTGTVLARKVFSSMCSKLRVCCHFHSSKDNVTYVRQMAAQPGVRFVFHDSWVWKPSEILAPGQPYKFVHFFRNPVSKVNSGFNYHSEGVEGWTHELPLREAVYCGADDAAICDSVRIFESPCHRAFSVYKHCRRSPGQCPCDAIVVTDSIQRVRNVMCERIRALGGRAPYQTLLRNSSLSQALLVETSFEYYESLAMALLVNQTRRDPQTLHVDLDQMMHDFPASMKQILRFLGAPFDGRGSARWTEMLQQQHGAILSHALTYDLAGNSMMNSMYNVLIHSGSFQHQTSEEDRRKTSQELTRLLCDSTSEVRSLLASLLSLMQLPLPNCRTPEARRRLQARLLQQPADDLMETNDIAAR